MAEKYIIRVTAGSDYNIDNQVVVPVNSPALLSIDTDLIKAEINVRVRNYEGLPHGSPSTSPYFALEPHAANDDQYSIAIRFTLKDPDGPCSKMPVCETGSGLTLNNGHASSRPSETPANSAISNEEDHSSSPKSGVSGHDLQFGNDFDHPIRDRLPPGFSYAMNIVKWWIDPGLDGDPYADMPYLYGPGLSSFNTLYVGAGEYDAEKGGLYVEEGGNEQGMEARSAISTPEGARERKKWALSDSSKDKWMFEYGQTYCVDFFNPYIDFKEFALRLPGFNMPIMKYWDGQGLRCGPKRSHALRYVLRNRTTGDTYLAIVFSLFLKEDVSEDGSLKPAALDAAREDRKMSEEASRIPTEDPAVGNTEKGAKSVPSGSTDDDGVD